jgi:hypothetical protein
MPSASTPVLLPIAIRLSTACLSEAYALIYPIALPPTTGGAGGWSRPSGLFAVLLTVLPALKAALVEPLRPDVAASEPEMALSCLALLEAGIRCGVADVSTAGCRNLCFCSIGRMGRGCCPCGCDVWRYCRHHTEPARLFEWVPRVFWGFTSTTCPGWVAAAWCGFWRAGDDTVQPGAFVGRREVWAVVFAYWHNKARVS